MNNSCGLNGTCICNQSSGAVWWHLRIRNQGGHTNAQSLQIYTQYLALVLTMMLVNIHPCYRCKQVIDRSILAQCQHSHYTVSTIPYEWKKHTAEECKVCEITNMSELNKLIHVCSYIYLHSYLQSHTTTGHTCESYSHNRQSSKTALIKSFPKLGR